MDVNDLRIAVTLMSFACFGGIVAWALARKNRARFEEAAHLPFAEEAFEERAAATGRSRDASSGEH